MSHTLTRSDLVYKAHSILLSDAGQTPSADDIAAIDSYVEPVFAGLAARDIVSIDDIGTPGPADDGEYPIALFLPAARALANAAAPEFGGQTDQNLQAEIEREMRQVVAMEPTYAPAQGEYF